MTNNIITRRMALKSGAGLAGAMLGVGAPSLFAQPKYPSKPVRVVLEFAAGTPADAYARMVTRELGKQLGQPFVIDNQAGGGGTLAASSVAHSAADGYTLLIGTSNALVLRPLLMSSNADVLSELVPITSLWEAPSVICVSAKLGVKTIKELNEYARSRPDQLSFATSGVGGSHHFNAVQWQQLAGIKLRHIPYKNPADYMMGLVSGDVDVGFANGAVAVPFLKDDQVRVLAVVEGPSPMFPGVPGLPDVVPGFAAVKNWTGLLAPNKLPPALIAQLNAGFIKSLNAPDVRKNIIDTGSEPLGESPEEFKGRIDAQKVMVKKLAEAANIKPES